MQERGFAKSAALFGRIDMGTGVYFAQGTIVRSLTESVTVENNTYLLENSVIIATSDFPAHVKSKTVFGHKSLIIGAAIGNLCEIGNNSIIMPGASLGDMCILGEGTLIGAGVHIPAHSVVVGRPGRIIRTLTEADKRMIEKMRNHDLTLTPYEGTTLESVPKEGDMMGILYAYMDKYPQVDPSALLFPSAEVTGDVVIGQNTIIGAGVKIIGDSHGPIRIGNGVQILENTVLHLLPDNELHIADDVTIGPGCVVHGCQVGRGTIIEPGAIIGDYSKIGERSIVKAGSVVKQRSQFPDRVVLEGFPAKAVENVTDEMLNPVWSLSYDGVKQLIRGK